MGRIIETNTPRQTRKGTPFHAVNVLDLGSSTLADSQVLGALDVFQHHHGSRIASAK